mgnify:FL=1
MRKLKVILKGDYSNFMRAVKFDKIECTYIGDDGKAHIEPFINILEESKINSSLIKRIGLIRCRGKDIRYLVAMAFVDFNVKCLDNVPKEFYSMSLFKIALDKGYPLADLPYIDELLVNYAFIRGYDVDIEKLKTRIDISESQLNSYIERENNTTKLKL